jgi:hypothetical protein
MGGQEGHRPPGRVIPEAERVAAELAGDPGVGDGRGGGRAPGPRSVGEGLGSSGDLVSPDPGVDGPRLQAGDLGDLVDGPPAGDQEDGQEPPVGPGVPAGVSGPGQPPAVVVVEVRAGVVSGGSHTASLPRDLTV